MVRKILFKFQVYYNFLRFTIANNMRCMYNISNILVWRQLYSWTTDSGLLFVDLIYIVFESMSATVTSPNVVVVLHGRNTSSQQLL